jgi:hypothetical protein
MIFIQLAIGETPGSTRTVDDVFRKYLPTFFAIANTFVYHNKSRQPAQN